MIPREGWETLTNLHRLDPRDGSVLMLIADVHEELGNDDAAREALTEYVGRFPEDETGYVRLARLQRRLGQHGEARASLDRAILIDPLSPEVTAALATLELFVGNFDEARAAYQRALGLARTAAARVEVLDGLKGYHLFRGEVEASIRTAEAWLEEASSYMTPLALAQERMSDVTIYLAAGADAAEGFLEEMKAQIPAPLDEYFIPYLESRIRAASDDLDAAREAHRQAVEMAEAMQFGQILDDLQRGLGRIDEFAGDYASAIDTYRAAMAVEPGASLPWATANSWTLRY